MQPRVRTASGSDRIIFHLSFDIWHLPLMDVTAAYPNALNFGTR